MKKYMKAITLITIAGLFAANILYAADAVTSRVIRDAKFQYVVHLTSVSDGTGETDVVKIDKSTLIGNLGFEPSSLDIEQVEWNIQGFTTVRLEWDHATDDTALILNGSGYKDFRGFDRSVLGQVGAMRLHDPRSSGGTGDILLNSIDASTGDSYDITLWVLKNTADTSTSGVYGP